MAHLKDNPDTAAELKKLLLERVREQLAGEPGPANGARA
jgi:hypothetical protein